jgi:DNA-binding response OmpR family regulator
MDSYKQEQLRASDNGYFGSILIVDDEPTYSYALVEILRADGYKVQLVTSGDKALDVMNELSPDLLLVDIVMPAMNGKTLISELRSTSAWVDLPIIVVSARTMPEDRAAALEAGADYFLPKPFSRQELRAVIQSFIPALSPIISISTGMPSAA